MRSVRGTKDLGPKESALFAKIVESAAKIASRYCFENFATPIMEYTEVFNRTLGETSDVVGKEMYTFIDRGGDSITLRPEFTAGIIRAVITEGLTHQFPLRLFSYGPVFRHDRPQAGRQRQFHQLNFEIIGENSYSSDAEAVKIGYDIINDLGIEDVKIEINSLGCRESRKNFQEKLQEYFSKYESCLSEDSRNRLSKNPMRIFDSKVESDQEIAKGAPNISDFYTIEARERFESTLSLLDKLQVPYSINNKLVRGLDYYSHTAFEYVTSKIGAQTAIGGGGRYDGLAKMMSKHDIPAIGLALGIERFMLLLEDSNKYAPKNIGIFPIGDESVLSAHILCDIMRRDNFPVLVYEAGKLGKRIEKASARGCNFAIFLGEDEAKSEIYKVKNLTTGEEFKLKYDELVKILRMS